MGVFGKESGQHDAFAATMEILNRRRLGTNQRFAGKLPDTSRTSLIASACAVHVMWKEGRSCDQGW